MESNNIVMAVSDNNAVYINGKYAAHYNPDKHVLSTAFTSGEMEDSEIVKKQMELIALAMCELGKGIKVIIYGG